MALTDSTPIPAAPHRVARDTRSVIAGTQQRETTTVPPAPPPAAAEIDRVRAAVSAALSDFLEVQRDTLAAMDGSLLQRAAFVVSTAAATWLAYVALTALPRLRSVTS